MKRVQLSWQGIAMTALFVVGGIVCLVLKQSEMGTLLFGAAIGQHFPEPVRPKRKTDFVEVVEEEDPQ